MPKMPPELQRKTLENYAARWCIRENLDPTIAMEAIDYVFDPTLEYDENKRLVEEELAARGVVFEFPGAETPEFEELAELPPYKPPEELKAEVERWREKAEDARTELGRLKERMKRWEELSERERGRILTERDEVMRRLEMLTKGVPEERIEELKRVFLRIPDTTDELFWAWFREHLKLIREHPEMTADAFESYMRDWLKEKRPPVAPPEKIPEIFKPPEPKFEIGERLFHDRYGEVTVEAREYDRERRVWTYVVKPKRGKLRRVDETELTPLPRKPPKPPVAPPKPEELVCPICGKPLERFTGPVAIPLPVEREVSIEPRLVEEFREKHPEWAEWEVRDAARREIWRMMEEGIPTTEVRTEMEYKEVEFPPGYMIYHCANTECEGFSRYYEVRDRRLHSIGSRDDLVIWLKRKLRELAKPITPPRPEVRRPPIVGYVPALKREFEVPAVDKGPFYTWLGPEGIRMFELSDTEQRERLYSNWKFFVKEKRGL